MVLDYFGEDGVVEQTHAVRITGGFTVVVRRLTGEEDDECNAILNANERTRTRVRTVVKANTSEPETVQETEMPADFLRYRLAVLQRGIKSWDLRRKGEIVPVTEANIQAMLAQDKNAVFLAIKEFDKQISEEAWGKSAAAPSSSSKG